MDLEDAAAVAVEPRRIARADRGRWFFTSLAAILIAVVAVGFARSFFLRGIVNSPKSGLPGYLVVHGIALTSWYLLFLVQSWLIAARHRKLHRSLGVVAVGVAILVFALSMLVVLRAPARDTAAGQSVAEISLMVIGDLGILLLFAAFITIAVVKRNNAGVHKRLMTLAAVTIVAPAIARWPGAEAALPLSVVVPQLSFCAALLVFDLVTRRRVHAATAWGIAAYLALLGVTVPLALSPLGRQLVNGLR